MTWYLVAPLTASQDAVTVPSARVSVTEDGVAGALDCASAGGGDEITTANASRVSAVSAAANRLTFRSELRFIEAPAHTPVSG